MRSGVLFTAFLLAGCPKTPPRLTVGMIPQPGRACSATLVGFTDVAAETTQVACHAVATFDLVPAGQVAVAMPPPNDQSGAVERGVPATGVARRRIELGDPDLRGDPWRVQVADDAVGGGGVSPDEGRTWRFEEHGYLVFVLSDRARSGTVYPFPARPGSDPRTLWATDPTWCVEELAGSVHVFPAAAGPVTDRTTWDDELEAVSTACSHTHAHVLSVDLGALDDSALDVRVELNNRSPRIFRLLRRPRDNYTIVDVIVEPIE